MNMIGDLKDGSTKGVGITKKVTVEQKGQQCHQNCAQLETCKHGRNTSPVDQAEVWVSKIKEETNRQAGNNK